MLLESEKVFLFFLLVIVQFSIFDLFLYHRFIKNLISLKWIGDKLETLILLHTYSSSSIDFILLIPGIYTCMEFISLYNASVPSQYLFIPTPLFYWWILFYQSAGYMFRNCISMKLYYNLPQKVELNYSYVKFLTYL